MFKLDRTAFKIQSFEQAAKSKIFWLQKTPSERFQAAWYLICAAYNIDYTNPPKMDKTQFSLRKNG
jgi:hypothetical protein